MLIPLLGLVRRPSYTAAANFTFGTKEGQPEVRSTHLRLRLRLLLRPVLSLVASARMTDNPCSNLNRTRTSLNQEDPSVAARLQRLQNNYEDFGMRRTVEGILVVHEHGHPCVSALSFHDAACGSWTSWRNDRLTN